MTIRKATLNDSKAIADCLLLAMEEIVYRSIGREDPIEAAAFMRHFTQKEANQYSWQNCLVAEEDGEVVAAVNVYDGARLSTLRQPVLAYISSRFHRDLIPEDETGPGEYYIDTLGVHPAHRCKGIGTALLQFLVDEYVQQQGLTLGLLVEEGNEAAKRLYLKLGFRPAGKKMLLGKNMEHLQLKG